MSWLRRLNPFRRNRWVYHQDGRRLEVRGIRRLRDWPSAQQLILKEFRRPRVRELQQVTIIFSPRRVPGHEYALAYIDNEEVVKGANNIYINPKAEHQLSQALPHELEHLLHAQQESYRAVFRRQQRLSKLLVRRLKKMKQTLRRNESEGLLGIQKDLIVLRSMLSWFVAGCQSEGLASFCDGRELPVTEKGIKRALELARHFRASLATLQEFSSSAERTADDIAYMEREIDQFVEELLLGEYAIGLHMVQVLVGEGYTIPAIESMTLPRFVREYERAVRTGATVLGRHAPLLSWSSGEGIIDYTRAVRLLFEAWQQLRSETTKS